MIQTFNSVDGTAIATVIENSDLTNQSISTSDNLRFVWIEFSLKTSFAKAYSQLSW